MASCFFLLRAATPLAAEMKVMRRPPTSVNAQDKRGSYPILSKTKSWPNSRDPPNICHPPALSDIRNFKAEGFFIIKRGN
jgi:hypothetical protein